MSSQSPKLKKWVLLELASKLHVVEVVEAVDRVPERLVVLFLDQKVVVRIVDRLNVELCVCVSIIEDATLEEGNTDMLYGNQI